MIELRFVNRPIRIDTTSTFHKTEMKQVLQVRYENYYGWDVWKDVPVVDEEK